MRAPDLPVYSFRKSFRAPHTHTHTHTLVRCKQASRLNTTNTFFCLSQCRTSAGCEWYFFPVYSFCCGNSQSTDAHTHTCMREPTTRGSRCNTEHNRTTTPTSVLGLYVSSRETTAVRVLLAFWVLSYLNYSFKSSSSSSSSSC